MTRPQTAAQTPPKSSPSTKRRTAAGLPEAMSVAETPMTGIMRMMKMAQE